MTILKDISNARQRFREQQGEFPTRLMVCACNLEQIKVALYQNTSTQKGLIPLKRYEGMEILVREQDGGWSL